ncbi:MAG: hypothetical protein EOO09_16230 [Chitinophagaceae bacterium]|nr:MAG: hypothetical protein EOO09_16230 [Chitinophagaceae bacterium]
MSFENQPAEQLEDVRHIRNMMERSSRFLSLSGFSGIAAGSCALIGAWVADRIFFRGYYASYNSIGYSDQSFIRLRTQLVLLAIAVFIAALGSAFYFTWNRTRRQGATLWNVTSRRLFWNVAIPLVAGGMFCVGMLWHNQWLFVAPASLFFYGLALINASKYTLTDIRFLGFAEVLVGFISMFAPGYSIYFWAIGFGVLHILYGAIMWYKYER